MLISQESQDESNKDKNKVRHVYEKVCIEFSMVTKENECTFTRNNKNYKIKIKTLKKNIKRNITKNKASKSSKPSKSTKSSHSKKRKHEESSDENNEEIVSSDENNEEINNWVKIAIKKGYLKATGALEIDNRDKNIDEIDSADDKIVCEDEKILID